MRHPWYRNLRETEYHVRGEVEMTVKVVIAFARKVARHVSKCPFTGDRPTGVHDGLILDEYQTLLHQACPTRTPMSYCPVADTKLVRSLRQSTLFVRGFAPSSVLEEPAPTAMAMTLAWISGLTTAQRLKDFVILLAVSTLHRHLP